MCGTKILAIVCTVVAVCYGDGWIHSDSCSLFSHYNNNHDSCLDVTAVVGVCYGDGLSHSDSRSLYSHYNKNHDSCLDVAEFSAIFMDMDTWPEDHQVSRAEFAAGWRHDHLHNVNDINFHFEIVDHAPRDNEITQIEMVELYNNVFDDAGHGCVSSSRFGYVWASMFAAPDSK